LRFIDTQAQFHHVPSDQVLAIASARAAIPFDIPGVELSHVGKLCSFGAFLSRYQLDDPAFAQSLRTNHMPGLQPGTTDLIAFNLRRSLMNRIVTLMASLGALVFSAGANAAPIDWNKVDQAIGKPGTDQSGGVHKFGLPRSDLKITVDGLAIKPTLALGSWIGFLPMGDGAMVMGDLVLTETEIEPVMKRLIDDGIEITAIHNHLLRTSPAVFYMHVGGQGDPVKLAQTLHAGLALSQTPFVAPAPAAAPPTIDLDTAAIDSALQAKGTINGGVYQFNIPRAEAITEGGMAIPPSLGTAIAINFQPTGAGKAAITGDFVLLGKEVNPVLKAMRSNGIEVTALHSHMIDDSPHLFFMHFWANDDVTKLTHGLRAALDLANVKRGT
jgi:hypothetical protein